MKMYRIQIKPSLTTSPLVSKVTHRQQFCCVSYHFCSLSSFKETKPCLFNFTLICINDFIVNGVYRGGGGGGGGHPCLRESNI